MNQKHCLLVMSLLLLCISGYAQTTDTFPLGGKGYQMPGKLLGVLDKKATALQEQLQGSAEKHLKRLCDSEKKLRKKLYKKDSGEAKRIFVDTEDIYGELINKIREGSSDTGNAFSNVYSSRLDSLKTAIKFLKQAGFAGESAQSNRQYQELLAKYGGLQDKLNQTEAITRFLAERQQALKQYMLGMPQVAGFKKLQQQLYYYRAQVAEYRQLWEDPSRLERQLTTLLCRLPEFCRFFDQYSDLGTVFLLPGNTAAPATAGNLQTRAGLDQFIQQTLGSSVNPQSQIQNSLPIGNDPLKDLSSRLGSLTNQEVGNGTGSIQQPDFKPNHQKTKSFLRRLEYGTTIQSTQSNYFFPATTDIALSVGYKLNDKSVIGVGGSGKIGWGKGFKDIKVTGEGMSVRSFLDVKFKGSFWVSGGWEYHYQQPFSDIGELHAVDSWKSSGLMGLTKTMALKTKGIKKYRIQLLYDFLHQQIPRTAPLKFRVGYNF